MKQHLKLSIAVLGAIGIFAVVGLAMEGNWSKAQRVTIAIAVYSCILLLVCGRRERISVLWFLFAAGSAEIASGWLRPDATGSIELRMVAAAGLLGFVHWLGLRASEGLRKQLLIKK